VCDYVLVCVCVHACVCVHVHVMTSKYDTGIGTSAVASDSRIDKL